MTKKFATFMNCGSYKCRMTPFFNTVREVEEWEEENSSYKTDGYIRPVSNWQEIIEHRNSYNCDEQVPIGY